MFKIIKIAQLSSKEQPHAWSIYSYIVYSETNF